MTAIRPLVKLVCQHCEPGEDGEFEDWDNFGLHMEIDHPEFTQVSVRIEREAP